MQVDIHFDPATEAFEIFVEVAGKGRIWIGCADSYGEAVQIYRESKYAPAK